MLEVPNLLRFHLFILDVPQINTLDQDIWLLLFEGGNKIVATLLNWSQRHFIELFIHCYILVREDFFQVFASFVV